MKYSILVSAFAAASMAGPIETRQEKKPFVPAPSDLFLDEQCDTGLNPEDSELCSGTIRYCNKKLYESQGEHFNSVQDCFRSREAPAFQESAPAKQFYNVCGSNAYSADENLKRTSEACLGTIAYCNQKIYEENGEPFDSIEACVKSRKGGPSGSNPEVGEKEDLRQKQAEFCANNDLNLSEAPCNIQFAQCAFENKGATNFDVLVKCVESRN